MTELILRLFRKLPLWAVTTALFGLQAVLLVTIIGYLSYNSQQQLLQTLSAEGQFLGGKGLLPAFNLSEILTLSLIVIISSGAIAFSLAYWVTQPLQQLHSAIKNLASGEPHSPLIVGHFHESQQLAIAFNSMAEQLQTTLTQLQVALNSSQQAEKTLQQSEQRYAILANSAPVGIFRNDLQGNCLYGNNRSFELIGLSEHESMGQGWAKALHPDDYERVIKHWIDFVENHIPFHCEYRFLQSDGSIVWVWGESVPEKDRDGNIIGYLGTLTDITKLKQTEAALQATETQLRNLAENIPGVLYRYILYPNGSHHFIYISGGSYDLYEYSPEIIQENPDLLWKVVHPDDVDSLNQSIQESAQALTPWKWEGRIITPSGKLKWLQANSKPIESTSEGSLIWDGIIFDISDRKQIELALQESRHFIERITDASPNYIYLYDLLENRNIYANREISAVLGYTAQEIKTMGSNFLEKVIHPDDFGKVTAHLDRCINSDGNELFEIEYRVLDADGSWRWLWSREAVFMRNSSGKATQIIGSAQDISERKQAEYLLSDYSRTLESQVTQRTAELTRINTQLEQEVAERKRAEEALQASETKFKAIFNQTFQFVGLLHLDGTVIEANQTALDFAGISREMVIGKFFWEAPWWQKSPETKEQLKVAIAQAAAGQFIRYEVDVLGFNQVVKTIDFSLRPIHDETGKVSLLIPEGRDISERKQFEAELKRQQDFFKQIIDVVPSAIFVKDTQGRFITINRAGAQMYSTVPENIIGKTDFDFNNDLDQIEDFLSVNKEVMASQKSYTLINQAIKQSSAETRWYQTIISPFIDDSNQVQGIIGASNDITLLKKAEEELRKAKDEAEDANLAKSVFIASMSHELRTPLNAILGFSQLLSRSPNLYPEQQEHLNIIRQSGEHLLLLINQVLDLSKIEAGKMNLQESSFDFYELLTGIQDMFSLKARDKGLKLSINWSQNVPQWIYADKLKLRQILINLIGNGIKFTDHGKVTAHVDSRARTENDIELFFEISDTGIGIPPEELGQLFKPFVQSAAGQKIEEGTGLGLAISREFINLMGGDIKVMSYNKSFSFPEKDIQELEVSIPVGTTFKFSIKVQSGQEDLNHQIVSSNRAIALAPNQPPYRILLVDDQLNIRQLLMQFLSCYEFEVQEASDGLEGIALWESWQPHLIFMDLRMPVMDGYEAIRQIRQKEQQFKGSSQKTVIIALTASALNNEQEEILKLGCDNFMYKPFQEQDIIELLRQSLGVTFIYEDSNPLNLQDLDQPCQEVNLAELADLSVTWRQSLHRSIIEGDMDNITAAIAQLPPQSKTLGDSLLCLAQQYQYEYLLNLLQMAESA